MKILAMSISNLRSFKYEESDLVGVEFGIDKLNLIIGPNGAGKSNLMEIIARTFSNLFNIDYSNGNEDFGRLIAVQHTPTGINAELTTPNSLTKNRSYKDKPSVIKLKVILEQSDIDNLNQVKSKKEILRNIDDRLYDVRSGDSYKDIFNHLEEIPSSPTEYDITLSDASSMSNQSRSFQVVSTPNIAFWYLRSFQMLRNAIDSYNDYLRPEIFTSFTTNNPNNNYEAALDSIGIDPTSSTPIARFNPMIQVLSVQERLNDITLEYSPIDSNFASMGRETKYRNLERQAALRSFLGGMTMAQSMSFEFVKEMILKSCYELIRTKKSLNEVIQEINANDLILSGLNSQLKWFDMKLSLVEFDPQRLFIRFKLVEGNHSAEVVDLSSGQKAIFNIASAIALTKVTDAVVIIDEIENHLHPGVQAKLRKMLLDGTSSGSQVIAVTHSPVFIDSSTLQYTYRVHHKSGFSMITECKEAFATARSKDLEAILNYTNGARIFFTDKVLLVEGITDELFFRAFFDRRNKGNEIEVMNVGGDTGKMVPWRTLVEAIGVEVFQVNDFDQAVIETVPAPVRLRPKPRNAGLDRTYFSSQDLIRIDQTIVNVKSHNKYYLKEGSLEEYYESTIPKTKTRKFERVVDFLGTNDWSKLNFNTELDEIASSVDSV